MLLALPVSLLLALGEAIGFGGPRRTRLADGAGDRGWLGGHDRRDR